MLSSLNSRSKKFLLIGNAERPPQTEFHLWNMFGSWEIKSQRSAYHLYGIYFLNLLPYKWYANFWDFISQEPNIFGRWNSVCGGLSAFPISRNFFDLEFRLESIYLGWMLFPRWIIPYPPPWYRSPATSKINISGTAQNQSLPFSHRVQVTEIFWYTSLSNR
jgi:hypothetical protein